MCVRVMARAEGGEECPARTREGVGQLVPAVGPLPRPAAGLLCVPGHITAPAWVSLHSHPRRTIPALLWARSLGGGSEVESQILIACLQQELTECMCH